MGEPLCPYFGNCGGCTSQNFAYERQVERKKKQLGQMMQYENIKVFTEREYFYRNRMDFIFSENGLGLRKKGDWKTIIPIDQCVIAEEKINHLMKEIASSFQDCDVFNVQKQNGTFRYAVIRCTPNDSSISFVLNMDSSRLKQAVEKIKEFAIPSSARNILCTYTPRNTDLSISSEYSVIKGKATVESSFLGKKFFYAIQGFFQNNSVMAEKLQEYVARVIKEYPTKDAQLLDLYGGVGTFGIINAERFKEVIIVENAEESIDAAEKNLQINNITNARVVGKNASHFEKLKLKQPLYVITDPPRSGMEQKVLHALNQQKPELIIYISCSPVQLRKDLLKLKGYEIKSVALFDFFPQTPHSEVVVELRKKE